MYSLFFKCRMFYLIKKIYVRVIMGYGIGVVYRLWFFNIVKDWWDSFMYVFMFFCIFFVCLENISGLIYYLWKY